MTETPPKEDSSTDSDEALRELAKYLAGGFAVVTTVLAAVGATSGGLERILRNESSEALFWFALIGVGIASGVVAAVIPRKTVPLWTVILVYSAGVVLFVSMGWTAAGSRQVLVESYEAWRIGLVVVGGVIAAILLVAVAVLRRRGRPAPFLMYAIALTALATVVIGLSVDSLRILLAVLSVVVVVLVLLSTVWPPHPSLRGVILGAGFIAFFVGLAGMFQLVVLSQAAKDRPIVEARLVESEGAVFLEGEVRAAGLRSDEHVWIVVEGLIRDEPLQEHEAGRLRFGTPVLRLGREDFVQTIRLSRTGPDTNGDVKLEIKVPVSSGLYERIQIAAFIVDPESSLRLETELQELQTDDDAELKRREAYDESNDVHRIDDEELGRRADYDEAHAEQEIDEGEKIRRAEYEAQAYDENVGAVELERRAQYDALSQKMLTTLLEGQNPCSETSLDRACVVILVPERPNRPSLTAQWRLPLGQQLVLDVQTKMIELSADDAVLLSAWAQKHNDEGWVGPIYEASLAANNLGEIDVGVTVIVDWEYKHVCVIAEGVEAARIPPEKETYKPASTCISRDFTASAVHVAAPTTTTTTTSITTTTTMMTDD